MIFMLAYSYLQMSLPNDFDPFSERVRLRGRDLARNAQGRNEALLASLSRFLPLDQ